MDDSKHKLMNFVLLRMYLAIVLGFVIRMLAGFHTHNIK